MAMTHAGAVKWRANKIGITVDELLAKVAAGFKHCWFCKVFHPVDHFGPDPSRYDGFDARCRFSRTGSVERCLDRSEMIRTKVWTPQRRANAVSPFKGKTHDANSLRKMSLARKGKPGTHNKPHTLESRAKMSASLRLLDRTGPRSSHYKHGLSAIVSEARRSSRYKQWRYDVFMRDRFTCQYCGDARGHNLNAHHIKHFAAYPELRYDLDNGVTLCKPCHKKEHARG